MRRSASVEILLVDTGCHHWVARSLIHCIHGTVAAPIPSQIGVDGVRGGKELIMR